MFNPRILVISLRRCRRRDRPGSGFGQGRRCPGANGTCTANSSAKIKLSPENGRIETEFEVDQNRNGVTWNVVLRRNGNVVVRTTATTRAPSGSFELRRRARK